MEILAGQIGDYVIKGNKHVAVVRDFSFARDKSKQGEESLVAVGCAVFLGSNCNGAFASVACFEIISDIDIRTVTVRAGSNTFNVSDAHVSVFGAVKAVYGRMFIYGIVSHPDKAVVGITVTPGIGNLKSTRLACVNLVIVVDVHPDIVVVTHKGHGMTALGTVNKLYSFLAVKLCVFGSILVSFELGGNPAVNLGGEGKNLTLCKGGFHFLKVLVVGGCNGRIVIAETCVTDGILKAVVDGLTPHIKVTAPCYGVLFIRHHGKGNTALFLKKPLNVGGGGAFALTVAGKVIRPLGRICVFGGGPDTP